ncbi:hypothetical protein V8F20_002523 [Naviculisporaceae sp. PSN 640]
MRRWHLSNDALLLNFLASLWVLVALDILFTKTILGGEFASCCWRVRSLFTDIYILIYLLLLYTTFCQFSSPLFSPHMYFLSSLMNLSFFFWIMRKFQAGWRRFACLTFYFILNLKCVESNLSRYPFSPLSIWDT